jgi:hypothetical protein
MQIIIIIIRLLIKEDNGIQTQACYIVNIEQNSINIDQCWLFFNFCNFHRREWASAKNEEN